MESKSWFKSKGVWSNVCVVVIALIGAIDAQFGTGVMAMPITQTIIAVLGVFGIYGRVAAKTTIK